MGDLLFCGPVTPDPHRMPLRLDVHGSSFLTAQTQATASKGAVLGGSWGAVSDPLQNGCLYSNLSASASSGPKRCRGLQAWGVMVAILMRLDKHNLL